MRVELNNVRKSHSLPLGFITVLHGIDLVLGDGELCLVTGPSGSGKTTLLNVIGGIARPTTGSIHVDGQPLREHLPGVSFAFQEPVFIPELTVLENLLMPAFRNKAGCTAAHGERLLELFGLAELFDLSPALLSSGERRRLVLARALLCTSRLLLFDEPLAFLDDAWREKAMELVLEKTRETRATLVIATTGTVPGANCFRQVRLLKGKVISDGVNDH
jgi:ABC-type nitrate/sulfonate/bicarbonate transport system ATPase subunit